VIEPDGNLPKIENKTTCGNWKDHKREAHNEDRDPTADNEDETSQPKVRKIATFWSNSFL
jgi:hypothetical protein